MEQNVEVHSRNQIKVATLVSYISIAVNIISGLLFTPWLIHQWETVIMEFIALEHLLLLY